MKPFHVFVPLLVFDVSNDATIDVSDVLLPKGNPSVGTLMLTEITLLSISSRSRAVSTDTTPLLESTWKFVQYLSGDTGQTKTSLNVGSSRRGRAEVKAFIPLVIYLS